MGGLTVASGASYSFGDTAAAEERLDLLATVFDAPSRAARLDRELALVEHERVRHGKITWRLRQVAISRDGGR
jgi:hypothetical protein